MTQVLLFLCGLVIGSGDLFSNSQPMGMATRFSILDPSKVKMEQGIQYTYQTFGNKGYSLGLYHNTLSYKLAEPLTLQLNLAYAYSPQFSEQYQNGNVLGGFRLTYQPNQNFFLDIRYGYDPESSLLHNPYDPFRPFTQNLVGEETK